MLRGIADLGINTNWLLTGEGEPFARHQQLTTTLGYLNSQTVEVQDLVNKL